MNLYERLKKVDGSLPDALSYIKERLWLSYVNSALSGERRDGDWTGVEKGIMYLVSRLTEPRTSSGEKLVLMTLDYLKNKSFIFLEDYYSLKVIEMVERILIKHGKKDTSFTKDLKRVAFQCSRWLGDFSRASRYLPSGNGKLYIGLISSFRKKEVVVGSVLAKTSKPVSLSAFVFKGNVFVRGVRVLADTVKAKIYMSKMFRRVVPFVSFGSRKVVKRKWFKELTGVDSFLDLQELIREVPELKKDKELKRIKRLHSLYSKSGDVIKAGAMNASAYLRILKLLKGIPYEELDNLDPDLVGDFYIDLIRETAL